MRKTIIKECKLLNKYEVIFDNTSKNNLFKVNRIYFLHNVPHNEERGGHAHINLFQLIIPLNGSFDILVDDGISKTNIHLNSFKNHSLYFPPGIWRELSNFTVGAVCLVLASEKYIESDYIRNYHKFKEYKNL